MGWDNTKPATSEKIRNLSSVITANWDAIEQGPDAGGTALAYHSLQMGNRTNIAASNDPTTDSALYYLYGKDDADGNHEIFGKDPSGNIIQMTRGTPTVADPGETFLPGGLIMKFGTSVVSGSAAATTAIAFATAFPNAIYTLTTGIAATVVSTSGVVLIAPTVSGFTWANNTGGVGAYSVHWVAIGS